MGLICLNTTIKKQSAGQPLANKQNARRALFTGLISLRALTLRQSRSRSPSFRYLVLPFTS